MSLRSSSRTAAASRECSWLLPTFTNTIICSLRFVFVCLLFLSQETSTGRHVCMCRCAYNLHWVALWHEDPPQTEKRETFVFHKNILAIVWHDIKGFQPEWCISTLCHAWDTSFWSGTLDMRSVNLSTNVSHELDY